MTQTHRLTVIAVACAVLLPATQAVLQSPDAPSSPESQPQMQITIDQEQHPASMPESAPAPASSAEAAQVGGSEATSASAASTASAPSGGATPHGSSDPGISGGETDELRIQPFPEDTQVASPVPEGSRTSSGEPGGTTTSDTPESLPETPLNSSEYREEGTVTPAVDPVAISTDTLTQLIPESIRTAVATTVEQGKDFVALAVENPEKAIPAAAATGALGALASGTARSWLWELLRKMFKWGTKKGKEKVEDKVKQNLGITDGSHE